jgi:hypothetical protein
METKEKFNAQPQYPRQRPQYQMERRLGVYRAGLGRVTPGPSGEQTSNVWPTARTVTTVLS